MNQEPVKIDILKGLVAKVAEFQGSLPDSRFCKRWRKYTGTPDKWHRRLTEGLKTGSFDGVDIEGTIEDLRQLRAILEGVGVPDEIYNTPFLTNFCDRVERIEGQTAKTDRRILAVLAGIGVGKTVACKKVLVLDQGDEDEEHSKRILITVPTVWRENKIAILNGIAAAIGVTPTSTGASAFMEAISLALTDLHTIIFDEAHQGGVMLMRILKDLVNVTQAKFVYVALQTEFLRVSSASSGAISEARQFIRRCLRPIFDDYRDGTRAQLPNPNQIDKSRGKTTKPGDIHIYLQSAGVTGDDLAAFACELEPMLRRSGNLSTLSDGIDIARQLAAKKSGALTIQSVRDGVTKAAQW
jgi:hypothetical protein